MMKTIHLKSGTPKNKRSEIRQYFLETMDLEESLFSLLKNEMAFVQQPDRLRHPLIFYYGHTVTFYINKLMVGNFISERINPHYESLFAIGVDEMSWDDLNEAHYEWPALEDLKAYREKVKKVVLNYIENADLQLPLQWSSPLWVILMGIEHQRIHLETSSVLIRQLDLNWIQPHSNWAPCTNTALFPTNRLLSVEGGALKIGKTLDAEYYGWDNEYGTHASQLKSFQASEFLVSNGEFLEFVLKEGYRTHRYWTEEGNHWRRYRKAQHPTFWILPKDAEKYWLRILDREIPLPLDWPVEVNYLEASAFCRWKGEKLGLELRLPTEDEWYQLYRTEEPATGNIHLEAFRSPCPVNQFKSQSFYDVIGNVWQWTETPIYPFEGFQVHPLYDDFSVPTFDGKHNLIKGGSWISTGNESLPEARYAFRRHFFQHAGFRYVQSQNKTQVFQNPYETESLLTQYCEFHYGDEYFGVANFPKACITYSQKYFELLPKKEKALDLGCALGRASMELIPFFNHVVGLDFSARFIEKAQSFLDSGVLRYTRATEGDLVDLCERNLEDLKLTNILKNSDKDVRTLEFYQGDACNLSQKYSDFDFIFAGNLIDRLYTPQAFLSQIHERLVMGGLLVLTSPYTWLEEYTPKKDWVGGFKKDGETITTLEGLKKELGLHFKLVAAPMDIPFVIRETQRKYQHSLAQMSVWQKVR